MIDASPATPVDMTQMYKALAIAQGQFVAIEKNRTVMIKSEKGSYQFAYADLEELISKTRPALSANGLAVVQSIGVGQNGHAFLDTVLTHESGATMCSRLPLPNLSELGDPKRFGAMVTYLRRYQYTAMLCLAADDDIDEDGSEMGQAAKPAAKSAKQRSEPKEKGQANGAVAGPGEVAWVMKKADALKVSLPELMSKHGVGQIDAMSMEQFAAVKADLLSL